MRVSIKDFQSLKGENIFEFPVGVTIIQGKTDSGKTTIFYAIEDCLSNPAGVADTINWDASACEVTIENDGGYVKWIKTPSSSEYVDKTGKSYVKASKLDSRDIDNLGFYIDKKGNIINIQDEWSTLFPFSSSDTEMFKLFEDIFNISSSFSVVDAIKKDEQEKKAQINSLTSSINELTNANNNLKPILESDYLNNDLEYKYLSEIPELQSLLDVMTNDYNSLSANQVYLNYEIPESFDISLLTDSSSYYNSIIEDYNNYLVNMKLKDIEIPDIKLDITGLTKIFNEARDLTSDSFDYEHYYQQLNNYEQALSGLEDEERELKEKLSRIKVCPTCGRPLED